MEASLLKILQVAQRTHPALGGVELHTAMISKKLVERGHKVTLVVFNSLDQRDCGFGITYQKPFLVMKPRKPSLPKEEYWNGVRILRFPSKAQLFSYYWSPRMLSWLTANIQNFDITHTHCFRFSNNEFVAIAHLLNKRRVPFVLTCHDVVRMGPEYMGYGAHIIDEFYRRSIGRILIHSASRLIALTDSNAHEYINYLFADPEKIRIIPNGIDLGKYEVLPDPSDLRERLGNPEQIILFIGRFVAYKNPDKLILGFKKVAQKYHRSHLLMIGKDYGMLNHCKGLASDLGKQVTFLENAPENIKLKALALANLCVVPSSYEGFGIVALESQASEVPVIAGKKGGLRDVLIHGVTGLHINPTINHIAESICFLLNQPELQRKMGREGKRFVKRFSWNDAVSKLETVYQEILEESSNG